MSKRSNEVRIGMSVYWVQTWEHPSGPEHGHFFALSDGVEHWVSGTRYDALSNAKECLRAREATANAALRNAPRWH